MIDSFEVVQLDFLAPDQALALFTKHCTRIKDEVEIAALLRDLDYHTLTIEILAKTAQVQRLTIEKLRTALQTDLKTSVEISHSNKPLTKVKGYLNSILSLSGLTGNEQWLMKHFCALPTEYIAYELLEELLQPQQLDWGEAFPESIESLYNKGWLLKDSERDSYKVHRIVAEVAREQLRPVPEDVHTLIDSITGRLNIDQARDNPVDKFRWVPFGNVIANLFSGHTTGPIATLQNNLAVVYRHLGNYEKARDLLEGALQNGLLNLGRTIPLSLPISLTWHWCTGS